MNKTPSIYLTFIMKNEEKILPRMLSSVINIIDGCICVDTGSTDKSKEIVKEFFEKHNKPVEIYDYPFDEGLNFCGWRNYLIEKSKGKCNRCLWVDCDEVMQISEKFDLSKLKKDLETHDCAALQVRLNDTNYIRVNFFDPEKFTWKGRIHEYLIQPPNSKMAMASGLLTVVNSDGASWADTMSKYAKHAEILEEEVSKHNDPRDIFYLAQSYRDCCKYEKAIEWYQKRVDREDGFYEERYFSQLQLGILMANSKETVDRVIFEWMKCSSIDVEKAEHFGYIIRELQSQQMWEQAYIFSKYAVTQYHNKIPKNRSLFLDYPLYSGGLLNLHIENCKMTLRDDDLNQIKDRLTLNGFFETIASAWIGHREFANWLAKETKANIIVDLGVDYGYSTFAFASARQGRVFGVDIFKGDAHAGARDTYKLVMDNVKFLKEKHKIDNIKIIKGDFNEVAKDWHNTIDILHIDGYHSYEAVKSDYETWSKFLADDGVVLFHDTVSHEGVAKFFNEINLPKLNFTNSAGLGVVSKNESLMKKIRDKYFQGQEIIKPIKVEQTDITICYIAHDQSVFEKYLKPSIKGLRGNFHVQYIPSGLHCSAANYNIMLENAKTDCVLFVHEDVTFGPDFLEKICEVISAHPDFGAIGAVGQDESGNYHWGEPGKIHTVKVLDSCCILVNKKHGLKFDDNTFDEFHLYVDDYTLQVDNLWLKTYTIPTNCSEAGKKDEYSSEDGYFKHHSNTVHKKGYAWGNYWKYNDLMKEKWSKLKLSYDELEGWTKKILDNIPHVKSVEDRADYIVHNTFMSNYSHKNAKWLEIIENKSKLIGKPYVAFLHDDPDDVMKFENGILFRTSFNESKSLGEYSLPSLDNESESLEPVETVSIGFCGALTNKLRLEAIKAFEGSMKTDFIVRDYFHLHYDKEKQLNNKAEFMRVMKDNPFQLCVRGAGNFSHRFYETMMYGRIPVLLDDDTPLPIGPDWDNLIIRSKSTSELKDKVLSYDKDIVKQQALCREAWEKYLSPKGFAKTVEKILLLKRGSFNFNQVDVCILSNAKTENLKKVTKHGIKTLLESEKDIKFNIIVVEGNENVTYENAKTIHTWKEFNYNAYMNLAAQQCNSPYIAFCNNDLEYTKGWASNIIKEMKANKDIQSASPFCPGVNKMNGSNTHFGYTIRQELNGWCIFMRREAYNKIGKLDEDVKFWHSDGIYADQIRFHGLKHALIQNSVVIHHENNIGKTGETLSRELQYEYTSGQDQAYIKARTKYIK